VAVPAVIDEFAIGQMIGAGPGTPATRCNRERQLRSPAEGATHHGLLPDRGEARIIAR